jgi:hypothetical protein
LSVKNNNKTQYVLSVLSEITQSAHDYLSILEIFMSLNKLTACTVLGCAVSFMGCTPATPPAPSNKYVASNYVDESVDASSLTGTWMVVFTSGRLQMTPEAGGALVTYKARMGLSITDNGDGTGRFTWCKDKVEEIDVDLSSNNLLVDLPSGGSVNLNIADNISMNGDFTEDLSDESNSANLTAIKISSAAQDLGSISVRLYDTDATLVPNQSVTASCVFEYTASLSLQDGANVTTADLSHLFFAGSNVNTNASVMMDKMKNLRTNGVLELVPSFTFGVVEADYLGNTYSSINYATANFLSVVSGDKSVNGSFAVPTSEAGLPSATGSVSLHF